MKVRVDRATLAEAVAWTARSLPNRPAAPVLAGLLFVTGEASATVSGFDYDTSACAGFPAEIAEPGRVLVHGKLLADIAKALPDRPVEIAKEGAKLLVECGPARFSLLTLPVEDYPALPTMPSATGVVPGSALAAAVGQVAVAVGRDDTIPMLTGVRVEIDGDGLTLVATDRFRLAYRELAWQPNEADVATTALIPGKTLSDAAKAFAGHDSVTVALASDESGIGLVGFTGGGGAGTGSGATGSRQLTSRLLSGEFVRYRSLFPPAYAITATMETASFLAAAKRVSLVAERSSPIRLSFVQGEVALEARAGDEAHASETLDAVLEGEDISVSFNPGFLLDGIQVLGTPYAQLSFTGPGKPAVLMGRSALDAPASEEFRYLMLPLRGLGQSAG